MNDHPDSPDQPHGRPVDPGPEDTAPLWALGGGEDQQREGARREAGAEEQTTALPSQDQYAQDQYAQDQYAQDQYAQDQYAQDQYGQGGYAQGPYAQDPYAQQQYGGYYPAYGDPYQQYAGAYPDHDPRPRGARLAGWVWPVVAATALVVGLVGGTMGGVLVSAVSEGEAGPTTSVFDEQQSAPAPLDPENGSVAAVAEALLPSTVQILTTGGSGAEGAATGSGFVINRSGHVITNNHVVSGVASSGEIEVVDHVGRRLAATIVGRSPVYDIAVLQIENAPRNLRPAALGSSQSMNIGETVVALGSPLGLSSTVTSGIVSAIDRPVTTGDEDESSFINAVQTDAAINPGNSGGPLVNLSGEVVGVNSAIATVGGFGSRAGNIGVGFAIPMEQVEVTASQIVETGEAQYPVIGANVNTGTRGAGAEIVDVPSGTPADEAGLEEGDVVLTVDDKAVADGIGLIVAIRSHQPGETIELTVRRGGQERTLQITLDGKVG